MFDQLHKNQEFGLRRLAEESFDNIYLFSKAKFQLEDEEINSAIDKSVEELIDTNTITTSQLKIRMNQMKNLRTELRTDIFQSKFMISKLENSYIYWLTSLAHALQVKFILFQFVFVGTQY